MKGKVELNFADNPGEKPVWPVKGEDGVTYECYPSRSQRDDVFSLMLSAKFEVEFETERDIMAGKTYARIVSWAGQGEWADGGTVDRAKVQQESARKPAVQHAAARGLGEEFINPYNFLGLADARSTAVAHSPHGGLAASDAVYSGSFTVELEALTPLLVPDSSGRLTVFEPEAVPLPDGAEPGMRAWFCQYKDQGKILQKGPFDTEREAEQAAEDSDAIQYEVIETPAGLRWAAHDSTIASGGEQVTKVFLLDGRPAIPLSSVRGTVRSLYEAVTNSCLSQFNPMGQEGWRPTLNSDKERDEYSGAGVTLAPGRVVVEPRGRTDGYIELASEYYKVHKDVLEKGVGRPDRSAQDRGQQVYFTQADGKVDRISTKEFPGSRRGVLKVSGRMPTKKNEYVLVFEKGAKRVPLTQKDIDQYRDVNKDSQLKPGRMRDNLVWVRLDAAGKMLSMGRGYIHKVPCVAAGEPSTYGKRLPSQSYLPCSEVVETHAQLCPGCGMFGTVMRRNHSAYGSRVAFGTARPLDGVEISTVPLRVLSGPKPQTGFFYLRRPDGGVADWNDPKSLIAGRKVYLHNTDLAADDYTRRAYEHSSQATTSELIGSGAKFSYTVRFRDLRAWEVGALLFACAPYDPRDTARPTAVKLGGGKPIGLGSMRATISDGTFAIDRRTERYASLDAHLKSRAATQARDEFDAAFATWLTGKADPAEASRAIGDVAWFADVVEWVAWQPLPRTGQPLEVKYPARVATGGKYKGDLIIYEWFSWARRQGGQQLPPIQALADGTGQLTGWGE